MTVTACGRSATVLLYNYGPPLPRGFPTNLPQGQYRIVYSASGPGVSLSEQVLLVLPLTDFGQFVRDLELAFDTAIAAVPTVANCNARVRYKPFDGQQFRASMKVSCSVAGVSVSVSINFRIERI